VHRESMSIIVQRDATICSFIIFMQTALHVPTPSRQRTVANTVRPVPDVVITVWECETCRVGCRNILKLYIVASCWTIIDIDVSNVYVLVMLSK